MSNQALYEKLGQTTELISSKLTELIKLASIESSSDHNEENDSGYNDNILDESELSVATSSVLMVNNQTAQLIKGVQDLLILTRHIREKWLLNHIPEQTHSGPQIDNEELKSLLNTCMKDIIGDVDI
ncbi:hypothetical protein Kpol_401p5 [Vanderwaltozyma polyspora DSM 70294]|uniref:Mediator of RNA polymerase II transcription subunit 22 n=1 Tax=Vanderwaltozyma polyspora (strain ATCC 22028 / DSM 70294 / BCRC 21397 / CBS 2163 / NBRC 10782 / NRRL Y-8283 / UCD 57-17) TaxID=436907 RepID=A7TRA4_VANPO|nr:uncharacterized protein Kpol_401p5 [Vanderwaltozyma polyspora DSM 70294]EDO15200.1 hypothetical protein Kpol_401p5 [Vanderwaltozyma polyspora DSM 70294]